MMIKSKNQFHLLFTVVTLTMVVFLYMTGTLTYADEYKLGLLRIDHTWVRVTIPDRPAAGYMQVHNKGEADKIIAVSSPMAKRIEMHTTTMKDGVMRMRPVKHINVPANGSVELKPGRIHLMVLGLNHSLKSGDKLPVTLVFAKAGAIDVQFTIKESIRTMEHSSHGKMNEKSPKH